MGTRNEYRTILNDLRKRLDAPIEIKSIEGLNTKMAFLCWETTHLHMAEIRGNVLEKQHLKFACSFNPPEHLLLGTAGERMTG